MDKEMMLEAMDIVRTVADHQIGFKKKIGQLINRIMYIYYKRL